MTAPVPITFTGHTSEDLHRFARECKGVRQALRVHAIAMLLDEATPGEAVKAQGTTPPSHPDTTRS